MSGGETCIEVGRETALFHGTGLISNESTVCWTLYRSRRGSEHIIMDGGKQLP